jgi:hypothetical protein
MGSDTELLEYVTSCSTYADKSETLFKMAQAYHAFMVVVAFNVEVNSSKTGAQGMIINLIWTAGCMISIGITVAFLQNLGW